MHSQTSYVAQGEIKIYIGDDKPKKLQEGDLYTIPSNVKHCIQLLSPTARVVESFTPIREDFL